MKIIALVTLGLIALLGIFGCGSYRSPHYVMAFERPNINCLESGHEIGSSISTWACPQVNLTADAPCDESLWSHIYHPKRLVVKQACISVTGMLVDASHGRNKDGCRHEADGDCHGFLKLDKGEEGLLNDKNRSNEDGNLVIEPICRYIVTQADAKAVCKGWMQPLVVPAMGTRVRVTGAYVLDTQHGHMEIHPISRIDVID